MIDWIAWESVDWEAVTGGIVIAMLAAGCIWFLAMLWEEWEA